MAKLWCSLLAVLLVVAGSCGQSAANGRTPLNGAVIQMVAAEHGWAYSRHLIARTSDGAKTFASVTPADLPAGAQLEPPLFIDFLHAFAFAIVWDGSTLKTSILERTSDGGATWKATAMSPAVDGDLSFFDSMHGWFVSGRDSADHLSMTDTLWRTTDGGATWSSTYSYTYRVDVHPSAQPGGCHWQGPIAWSSTTDGIVGVSCPFDAPPAVDATRDGGLTWTRRNLPDLPSEPGIALFSGVGPVHVFNDGSAVAVVGRCVGSDGTSCFPYGELYRSGDGGLTWTRGADFRASGELVTLDAGHSWFGDGCLLLNGACTTPGLLTTDDGGAHWRVHALPGSLQPNMHGSRSFSLVSPVLAFVSASDEFSSGSRYYRTSDGGLTFDAITPALTSPLAA